MAALAAVALGLVAGFGHRAGAAGTDPMLRAYVAAGGDLAALCGDLGSLGAPERCDVCRLLGAAVLPDPSRMGRVALPQAVETATDMAQARSGAAAVGWRSRAPPRGVV